MNRVPNPHAPAAGAEQHQQVSVEIVGTPAEHDGSTSTSSGSGMSSSKEKEGDGDDDDDAALEIDIPDDVLEPQLRFALEVAKCDTADNAQKFVLLKSGLRHLQSWRCVD